MGPLANIIENAFSPLITAFESVLVFIHNQVLGGGTSWGWAIIGLTVAVRLVLFPLFVRQMRSIVTLQRHMPEMKAIQEKYKDDRQRQSEELMKFYRENHINPLASCLPLLLQMPVLISLFYVLRTDLRKKICGPSLAANYERHLAHLNAVYHAHVVAPIHGVAKLPAKYVEHTSCEQVAPHAARFLFIPDLTTKATGWVLGVMLALYVLTMITSSLISTATADRNQRLMAIGLPLVFTFIVIGFPAGLLVYWISTNLWTIGQGYIIRRRMPPPAKTPAGTARKGGAPETIGPSSASGGGPLAGRIRALARGDSGDQQADAPAAEQALETNGTGPKTAVPPPPPRKRRRRRSGRRR